MSNAASRSKKVNNGSDPTSFAELLSRCHQAAQRTNDIVVPGLARFLDTTVLQDIETLLVNDFPKVKRRVMEHNGLRKDLESYRRRVRKLQQLGKDAGDKVTKRFNAFSGPWLM